MAKKPMKMSPSMEKKDRAADRKAGIKEGSKKDNAMDAKFMKKRGK